VGRFRSGDDPAADATVRVTAVRFGEVDPAGGARGEGVSEFGDEFESPREVDGAADGATPDAAAAASIQGESGGESTGSPVSAAMRELDTIGERDLAEHPDVYQRIHTELQAALTTIDDA
jgi:hypothetical protein